LIITTAINDTSSGVTSSGASSTIISAIAASSTIWLLLKFDAAIKGKEKSFVVIAENGTDRHVRTFSGFDINKVGHCQDVVKNDIG
jgi:hypothetical protein